jgi:hypothetical protein
MQLPPLLQGFGAVPASFGFLGSVTSNSLYSTWDNQFYPDGVPGTEVMANAAGFLPFHSCALRAVGTIMQLWRSIHELGRSRRAVVLTPLIIALVAVLLWTLEHTDIVAFATISIAALVLFLGHSGRPVRRLIAKLRSQTLNRFFYRSVSA